MKSKGGSETGALNDFSCGSLKKSHVNMTADSAGSPSMQNHPAATCNSTYYPEREREKMVEEVSERGGISLMGLMGGRDKQKLLTLITNMATQRSDYT